VGTCYIPYKKYLDYTENIGSGPSAFSSLDLKFPLGLLLVA
jgi:hypothetical protein